MVTKAQQKPTRDPAVRTCTAVDGCTGEAVLQASRSCDECGQEATDLIVRAEQRQGELEQIELREEDIKTAARARDGQCGCGDPGSHDGSPAPTTRRAKKPADFVTQPQPCPRPQTGDLNPLEVLDLALSAGRRQELGEQIEQLHAAAGRVAKEHTHPVFACEKHVRRLPK